MSQRSIPSPIQPFQTGQSQQVNENVAQLLAEMNSLFGRKLGNARLHLSLPLHDLAHLPDFSHLGVTELRLSYHGKQDVSRSVELCITLDEKEPPAPNLAHRRRPGSFIAAPQT